MIAILFHEELKEYDFGIGHPLRGDRFESFPEFLKQNFKDSYKIIPANAVKDEDLYLICDKDYIEFNKKFFNTSYHENYYDCLLYTSPSPRDRTRSRMPSSA